MEKLKYCLISKVALVEDNKTKDAYIDSGDTHKFFHRKGAFKSYVALKPERVQAAVGETNIIRNGTVLHNIDGKIVHEAYHTPDFSLNILASHILSEVFEVLQSKFIRPYKRCVILKKGSFSTKDIKWAKL